MQKHLVIFLFLCTFPFHSHAILESSQDKKIVQRFIDAAKTNDPVLLSTLVQYPLRRPHPLPDIQSPQDFIHKYDMLLGDKEAHIDISSSSLDDWSHVGWRGIMLGNGCLWLDEDGKLIALNAMSKKEQAFRMELLKKDRANLHPSLRSFDTPVVILETDKGRIRIDQIGQTYRYAFLAQGKINVPKTGTGFIKRNLSIRRQWRKSPL